MTDADCRPGQRCAVSTGRCVAAADQPDIPGVETEPCQEGERRFCGSKIGACEYGTQVCVNGVFSAECEGGVGPTAELCDGIDNDCDGSTDEDFADLQLACQVGLGICEQAGVRVCAPDGSQTICTATPLLPNPLGELCGNALDDDCDGLVDEGYNVGTECLVGIGACQQDGVFICTADALGTTCSATPTAPDPEGEICGNGIDDDCDGQADEGFDVGTACGVGVGACNSAGVKVCAADGRSTVCDATSGAPVLELCGNGIDDDCDGQVDEGFDVNASCSSGVGVCERTGMKVCSGDRLSTVCGVMAGTPNPSGELCGNGIDDDCDGGVDEGFDTGAACEPGVGICKRSGVKVCTADLLGTQCNVVAGVPDPLGELCGNLLDDDCDGSTDEGYDVGAACSAGVGACNRTGVMTCSGDRRSTVCNAAPGTPQAERCGNMLDDDCDGSTDEGFDVGAPCSVGVGTCQASGQKQCSADGTTTVCSATPGQPNPSGEVCGDGLDNDCDGQVDEQCLPPVAVCAPPTINTVPLATILLDGSGSYDPNGLSLTYNWVVRTAPTGSTSDPAAPFSATSNFYVDLAGTYSVELIVTNSMGQMDSCTVTLNSIPPQRIHVQLVWQEDYGDVDLHLTKYNEPPLGAFFDESSQEKACWWRNTQTDWGPTGSSTADATLDIDDTAGNGPENINITVDPVPGDYHVGVHMYCDQSITGGALSGPETPLSAKVRIYCNGVLASEIPATYHQMQLGQLWIPARIHWDGTGCSVTPLGQMEWGVKYCRALGTCTTLANDCMRSKDCSSDSDCRAFESCLVDRRTGTGTCRLNSACTTNSNCTSGMTCSAEFGNLCAR